MTVRPTSRDKYVSAAALLAATAGETALLAFVGARLARRLHRQFGTPYAPLSRREAFVTAYLVRYVSRLLKPSDMSALMPEGIAEARQDAEREALRRRLIRRGEQVGSDRSEWARSSVEDGWDFTATQPEADDPVDLMEQMRAQRQEAAERRQGRK